MTSFFPQLFAYQFFVPTILRIMLGVFFILFGYLKFKDIHGKTDLFFSLGIKQARFWVLFIAILEFITGSFLLLGFLTQLASIISSLLMVGAIFTVGKVDKRYGFYITLLIVSISLLLSGPGSLSIDLPL